MDLATVKSYLDVIHDADDDKIELLLEAAEDEALRFCNLNSFPSEIPASMEMGILLLVQANYQAQPSEIEILRKAAEYKLMPYRAEMGV